MASIKMDDLLKMIALVRTNGVIEDAVFNFEKGGCTVNAIDVDANVLIRINSKLGMPAWGKLGISNLKYFLDLFAIAKGRDVVVDYDDEKSHLIVLDKKLEGITGIVDMRYQLSDLDSVRCKVVKEDIMDEVMKQLTPAFELDKVAHAYCLDRLKVSISASVTFDLGKDGDVKVNIGQAGALESLIQVPLGKVKSFKKECSIAVNKDKLIAVMETLEFPSETPPEGEEKPKLKKKPKSSNPNVAFVLDPEQNLVVFYQEENSWVVSEVRR